jgi:hypothetical protein
MLAEPLIRRDYDRVFGVFTRASGHVRITTQTVAVTVVLRIARMAQQTATTD